MLNTPFIKDIYDPLTGSHDGTITPSAPIVVTGENLRLSALEETVLGLAPLENSGCPIQISHVCKYTDTQLLVVLPNLDPGTYSPVLQVYEAGKLVLVYVFRWYGEFAGRVMLIIRLDITAIRLFERH